ncbi:aldo/keto reductase [Streptomyces sp. XM4193]|uniref:aldo/keto reductase n=1 Tax=Streptomyces sp. XM4193 TaxID=2929782 RepID=UPI001FF821DC|nr:aldo/keto reductase [Streptomyces sp. XM4193]MCK1798239.1 aldo/keto reductase [Streptomyces sp. XM4193]
MTEAATPPPNITLNNGVEIPQLGFGTYQIDPATTGDVVGEALRIGYRHIDTAQLYGNERGVGEAVRASGLPREDVFVTSKLANDAHAYDDAMRAFDRTLADLDIGHLDLFLIHWPMADSPVTYTETWRAMEAMHRSGRVRAIGVSNFEPAHLERLMDSSDTVPAVNQIEVNPYLTQHTVREFNKKHGIATEAWSPIAQGRSLDDPAITGIAEEHGRTSAQVTLRWHVQRGDIVFPKSTTPSRMRENFEIFDFQLSPDEMALIAALNRDERTGPAPSDIN